MGWKNARAKFNTLLKDSMSSMGRKLNVPMNFQVYPILDAEFNDFPRIFAQTKSISRL